MIDVGKIDSNMLTSTMRDLLQRMFMEQDPDAKASISRDVDLVEQEINRRISW